MDIEQLMEIAHEAYPDETTRKCWDPVRRRPRYPSRGGLCSVRAGDTLAEFVVKELFETFEQDDSDERQLARALGALDAALGDMGAVAAALKDRLDGIASGKTADEDAKAS